MVPQLIGLKAALYEEESQAKRAKLGEQNSRAQKILKRRGRLDPKFCGAGGANKGVAERNARDAAEDAREEEKSSTALSNKVELYQQMTSGGGAGGSDDTTLDGGNFLVDFFGKGEPKGRAEPINDHTPWATAGAGDTAMGRLDLVSNDMQMEADRQEWEAGQLQSFLDETKQEASRTANVELLKKLSAATATARQSKVAIKSAREQTKLSRLERIRAKKAQQKGDTSALASLLSEEERKREEAERAALNEQRAAEAEITAKREAEARRTRQAEEAAAAAREASKWQGLHDQWGRPYYCNSQTQQTQWECPAGVDALQQMVMQQSGTGMYGPTVAAAAGVQAWMMQQQQQQAWALQHQQQQAWMQQQQQHQQQQQQPTSLPTQEPTWGCSRTWGRATGARSRPK